MPKARHWWTLMHQHHDAGAAHAHQLHDVAEHHLTGREARITALIGAGVIAALLAQVQAQRGIRAELRKLRTVLTQPASLNLTGRLVPKQGGDPMPAGPFNPTETEDVSLATDPKNAAGTSVPADKAWWSTSDNAAGTLTVADDGKSALFVTAAGPIDVIVTVADPRTGVTESVRIQRAAADVNVAVMNLTGQVVPKTA